MPSSDFFAREGNFALRKVEFFRLDHFVEKVNKVCNGREAWGRQDCPFFKTDTHRLPNTNLVLNVIKYPK